MCQVMRVSSSAYYHWLKEPISKREVRKQKLISMIEEVHQKSRGIYGSPRITNELNMNGISISRRRVAQLMKQEGIRSKIKRKFRGTTDSDHTYPIAPNLLNQQFNVDQKGKVSIGE